MDWRVTTPARTLLFGVLRFDRSRVTFFRPIRDAIGVVTPLAVGAAIGQPVPGLTASIGALEVAFSDQPGPYGRRAAGMVLTGLAAALSVFVGSVTASIPWLAIALALVWGLAGGILVALGTMPGQVGLTSIILLLVFSAHALSPDVAVRTAGLVVVGAALQIALALAAWPFQRLRPQRDALASMFSALAAYARAPSGVSAAPPATAEITTASQVVHAGELDATESGETLRGLLDEAERIRLSLTGLTHVPSPHYPPGEMDMEVDTLRTGVSYHASRALDQLAAALTAAHRSAAATDSLRTLDTVVSRLRQIASAQPGAVYTQTVLQHAGALARELKAAAGMVDEIATRRAPWPLGATPGPLRLVRRPPQLRLHDPAAQLRANLTLRSAACRHAVRLALCVALADVVANALGLTRGYWVPMTVAIVLKPDFTATFTRGAARLAGTLLGLLITTGLVYLLFGQTAGRIALVAVLVFLIRSVGPANYALLVVAVSGMVVALTSFAGAAPDATIVERGVNTLIGGALALAAYALWPTWERTQSPPILADLLDAYRTYIDAVLAAYLDPAAARSTHIERLRLSARLARSNAEASLTRLASEPATPPAELDRDTSLLVSSHRLVNAAMALEAQLVAQPAPAPVPSAIALALRDFTGALDATLEAHMAALRDRSEALAHLPDLAAAHRALAEVVDHDAGGGAETSAHPSRTVWATTLTDETDRMTEAANSMTHALTRTPA